MHTHDGYSIKDYGEMVLDKTRTSAYIAALSQAITAESVVLEIGTGAGFFALLACKLGAKKVYAIEPDIAMEVGKQCVKNNPGTERIVWLSGLSTDIELPEKVDIVLGDLHGTLPFYNFNLLSMRDAVARHLKPGGIIMPKRDVLRAVPLESPEDYNSVEKAWATNVHGLDLSAGRKFLQNTWWRRPVNTNFSMLSTPQSLGTIDYLDNINSNMEGECDWRIEADGVVHGLALWFDSEIGPGAGFSNAPDLPGMVYGNAFFPLEQAIHVVQGERLQTKFSAKLIGDEYIYTWVSEHFNREGKSLARFRQSTFNSRPLTEKKLAFASPDYIPALNKDGKITLCVLQAIATNTSMADIAVQLFNDFPGHFENQEQATGIAIKIVQKFQS
jgi:type I protein arginine methyltransferase